MNLWQSCVRDFHEKFGVSIGDTINLDDRELRAKLILEEACETVAAMGFDVEAQVYTPFPGERIEAFAHDSAMSGGDFDPWASSKNATPSGVRSTDGEGELAPGSATRTFERSPTSPSFS